MKITIEPLNHTNWYKLYDLSVNREQKRYFSVPNVQWMGKIYAEAGTELLFIKYGGEYVGLMGVGLYKDGVSGHINPLIADERLWHQGIVREAMSLIINHLICKYHITCIHVNHRKENSIVNRLYESLGFTVYSETEEEYHRNFCVDYGIKILSLREYPERADECRKLLLEHFNEFTSQHPLQVVASTNIFPQGYFMLKNGAIIGWTGLHEKEVVAGRVYGWEGTLAKEEVLSDELSPWITPLLVHPDERGNHYGKLLLEHARREAGRLGFKIVYLTTGEIGYYEKYGFREVGLTAFTWGRPTKIYEHDTITE